MAFLADELLPSIERKYRTQPLSVLIEIRFSFVKDGKRQVSRLILHQEGEDNPVKKIK